MLGMDTTDLLGWMAASATLLAFNATDMQRLRLLAIASNLCFIAYGLWGDIPPVLALHLILLPLNLRRLYQSLRDVEPAKLLSEPACAASLAAQSVEPGAGREATGRRPVSAPTASTAPAKLAGGVALRVIAGTACAGAGRSRPPSPAAPAAAVRHCGNRLLRGADR